MALSNKAKKYLRKNLNKSPKDLAKYLNTDLDEVKSFIEQVSQEQIQQNEPVLDTRKRIIFSIIALFIPILFFAILEISLRASDYRGDTDMFVTMESLDNKYKIANPNFAARYFFYTTVIPNAPAEPFLTEKPSNGFRVFVMGESSAAGYPYGFNGIFGRVVEDVLQDVMPDKEVEVITVAMSAINTYTLFDQVDELLTESPDAILIYTGHNEFYGALGAGSNESLGSFPAFVRFYLKIQNIKTFLFLRDQITSFSKWITSSMASTGEQRTETLMQQVVRDQSITLDSPVYDLGKRQFSSNMNEILSKFESAGVPVFLGSLASNLKDHTPFESVETDDHPPAERVYQEAKELYAAGNLEFAYEKFKYARDLDALKFRATSEFNDIIKDLAGRPNVYYVPVEERLIDKSDNGIIGFDLMLEHLHPNQKGYFHIGMAFVDAFRQADFLGQPVDVTLMKSEQDYSDEMYLSEFDHLIVEHRLRILTSSWPFVKNGPPHRYRAGNFKNVEDSLAFEVVYNKLRWDAAKVQLSEYYIDTNQPEKMLYEFRGLMRDQPFNDSPFLISGQYYLDQGQLATAKPFLQRAHEISPTAYTYKMLGAIEVDAGNFADGIQLLEQSLAIQPGDTQAMFNLSGAYAQVGEIDKGYKIASELVNMNPSFPGAQEWKSQLQRVIQSRDH
jgi:tetratricopeptide (TPR) repeat protein